MEKSWNFVGGVEDQEEETNQKFCVDCKATSTPLWRSGPAGPKSLCNACGIRYTKKTKKLGKSPPQVAASPTTESIATTTTTNTAKHPAAAAGGHRSSGSSATGPLKVRIVYAGKREMKKDRRSPYPPAMAVKKQRRRTLTEEEVEAAVCLMALSSCGSIFA